MNFDADLEEGNWNFDNQEDTGPRHRDAEDGIDDRVFGMDGRESEEEGRVHEEEVQPEEAEEEEAEEEGVEGGQTDEFGGCLSGGWREREGGGGGGRVGDEGWRVGVCCASEGRGGE